MVVRSITYNVVDKELWDSLASSKCAWRSRMFNYRIPDRGYRELDSRCCIVKALTLEQGAYRS
jgi:hypothetical protein